LAFNKAGDGIITPSIRKWIIHCSRHIISMYIHAYLIFVMLRMTVLFFFLNSGALTLLACRPEPHILLFRRPLGTDPQTGRVDPELLRQAKEEYANQFGLLQKA
jgi:hypothetical protein